MSTRDPGASQRAVASALTSSPYSSWAVISSLGPTLAFSEVKRLLNDTYDRALAAQLGAEVEAFARCAATRDFAEGVTAFVEKRKPNFKSQ